MNYFWAMLTQVPGDKALVSQEDDNAVLSHSTVSLLHFSISWFFFLLLLFMHEYGAYIIPNPHSPSLQLFPFPSPTPLNFIASYLIIIVI